MDFLDALTMGEIEELEDSTGISLDKVEDPDTPKARLIMAITRIISRRSGTEITMDEARAMTIAEMERIISSALDVTVPKAGAESEQH